MEIVYLSPDKLKPYPGNAKKHPPEQVEHIANSIKQFGWRQPIVVDKDNVVVIGHGRLFAAKELGLDEVPVTYADDLSPEQINALRLADNKTNESEWDYSALEEELAGLAIDGIDMTQFGFEDADFQIEEPKEIVEDEPPEPPEEPKSKRGDIYQLGRHRLMCGDSTSREDVAALMGGGIAALLLTDPPYGIDIVSHNTRKIGGDKPVTIGKVHGNAKNAIIQQCKEYMPVIGDDTTDTAKSNYEIATDHTKNQIIFGGNYFTDFLPPSRCWVVWDKENSGTFADAELAWTSFDKVVKLYHFMWNGLCREGSRTVEGKTRVHPTQKPVGMLANILKDFSEENDLILDCFGGSGSTLIACEQTNRNCYMMELDPHYIDVIIQRWENLTGEQAVLLNG